MTIIILLIVHIVPIILVFLFDRADLFLMSLVPGFNWYIIYKLIVKKIKK